MNPMLGMALGGANDISTQMLNQLGQLPANAINYGQYLQGLNELYSGSQRYMDATRAASGHYSDMYGGMGGDFARQYQNFAPGLINDYAGMSANLQRQYGDERNQSLVDYQNTMGNVNAGYSDRYNRNMAYLEGAGAQERKDINRQFDTKQSNMAADLAERGLGGTTVLPSLSAGLERNRSDAIGGLEERLRQQRLSTDANLSGDALSARERLGTGFANFRYGSGQDMLNFNKGLDAGGIAMRQGLGQWGIEGDLANRYRALQGQYAMDMAPIAADWEASQRRTNYFDMLHANPPPPIDNSGFNAALGAAMAPQPQQPKTDWYSPLVNAGGSFLGGYGYGAGMNAARPRTPDVVPGMYGIP